MTKVDTVAQTVQRYGTKPEWTWGSGAGQSLAASNAQISGSPNHAPSSQPFTEGYDIKAATITDATRLAAVNNTYNGMLCDGEFQLPVLVMNIAIDIAQSGTTAQSRWTRDFYPHNFTQPNFTVNGQSLNQGDYGKLCEFIHQAQQKAVFDGFAHLTQISVGGGQYPRNGQNNHSMQVPEGQRMNGKLPQTKPAVTTSSNTYPNQVIKGRHKPICAKGYITTISRQHQTGVVAPTWSFTFTVAYMIEGPYEDTTGYSLVSGNNWITMLAATQAQPGSVSTTPGLVKTNTKYLAVARKNSANIYTNPSS